MKIRGKDSGTAPHLLDPIFALIYRLGDLNEGLLASITTNEFHGDHIPQVTE